MIKVRKHFAAIMIFATMPCAALAQAVTLTDCAKLPHVDGLYTCEVRNDTQTAIAAVSYTPEVTKKGRSVPFVVRGSLPPITRAIPGGIEPGETMPVTMTTAFYPSDSQRDGLEVTFHILAILDVDGKSIELN